jgi:hypothetical protein
MDHCPEKPFPRFRVSSPKGFDPGACLFIGKWGAILEGESFETFKSLYVMAGFRDNGMTGTFMAQSFQGEGCVPAQVHPEQELGDAGFSGLQKVLPTLRAIEVLKEADDLAVRPRNRVLLPAAGGRSVTAPQAAMRFRR